MVERAARGAIDADFGAATMRGIKWAADS